MKNAKGLILILNHNLALFTVISWQIRHWGILNSYCEQFLMVNFAGTQVVTKCQYQTMSPKHVKLLIYAILGTSSKTWEVRVGQLTMGALTKGVGIGGTVFR